MHQIVTLTLNPAIDKNTSVEVLIAEQKMDCTLPKYDPGGGGINVARGLKRLGVRPLAVFPSGGPQGKLLENLLQEEGMEMLPVPVQNPTRENFIVVNTSNNQQYRFGMPGAAMDDDEEQKLLDAVLNIKAAYFVASGSLPKGIHPDFLAKVAAHASKIGARYIVDTSGEALQNAVNEGVYLLKPNLRELGLLVGAEALDEESAVEAAREIIGKGKCQIVVVSMGAQGAQAVSKTEKVFVAAPVVKKKSTVGAGDSMVAGMVYAMQQGRSLPEIVGMGVACGSAATMNAGTELFKKEDAEKLYETIRKRSS